MPTYRDTIMIHDGRGERAVEVIIDAPEGVSVVNSRSGPGAPSRLRRDDDTTWSRHGIPSKTARVLAATASSRHNPAPSAQAASTNGTFALEERFFPHRQQSSARFSVAKAKRTRSRRASHYQHPPASRLFDDALALASTLADSRKRAGADRIVELASATREFGANLNDFPQLRGYSNAAANNLDDLADYVATTDIPDMLDDFASFAKRQPIATLTLGVAAGLAFTQLMHGWPVPTKNRRKSSNGGGRRRRRRRKALN